jgi:hypothetical protein
VCDESVDACTFVDLVEVRKRCAGKELPPSISGEDRWTLRVVE